MGALPAVGPVQVLQQRPLGLGQRGRPFGAGIQIQHGRPLGAESGALIHRRQPGRLPVGDAVDRQSLGVVQHHVGGQVLILGSQPVGDPGAHRGTGGDRASRLHEEDGGLVVEVGPVHGADQGDIVHAVRQMGHQLRQLHARLSVPGEAVGRGQQSSRLGGRGDVGGQVAVGYRAGIFPEQRLGVEQVHLAGTPVHEQVDDGPGPGIEMGSPRPQVVALAAGSQQGIGGEQLLAQDGGQGGAVEQRPRAGEPLPPGKPGAAGWGCLFHPGFRFWRGLAPHNHLNPRS